MDGLEPLKQIGIFAYWMAKLKPLRCVARKTAPRMHLVNEIIALMVGIAAIKCLYRIASVPKELVDEIIYTLRYRNTSQENITLILKALLF